MKRIVVVGVTEEAQRAAGESAQTGCKSVLFAHDQGSDHVISLSNNAEVSLIPELESADYFITFHENGFSRQFAQALQRVFVPGTTVLLSCQHQNSREQEECLRSSREYLFDFTALSVGSDYYLAHSFLDRSSDTVQILSFDQQSDLMAQTFYTRFARNKPYALSGHTALISSDSSSRGEASSTF